MSECRSIYLAPKATLIEPPGHRVSTSLVTFSQREFSLFLQNYRPPPRAHLVLSRNVCYISPFIREWWKTVSSCVGVDVGRYTGTLLASLTITHRSSQINPTGRKRVRATIDSTTQRPKPLACLSAKCGMLGAHPYGDQAVARIIDVERLPRDWLFRRHAV